MNLLGCGGGAKWIGGAGRGSDTLEATCAPLLAAGLHLLLLMSPSTALRTRGIALPKNSRRYKMPQFDYSIHDYEETVNCKPSDVCKEEFKTVFRCRCPASGTFFFCKGVGKYYDAKCRMGPLNGYIWVQKDIDFIRQKTLQGRSKSGANMIQENLGRKRGRRR